MPPEPNEPPARPARIIVPGAEPRAEEAGPPRIVAPGGPDPEAAPVAPRIVLPPGVARETEVDVPEYPRLSPLVLVPVCDVQRVGLKVSDTLGDVLGQTAHAVE